MQLNYKEEIPNWICLSCKYLAYSIKGVLWCDLSDKVNHKELIVSPYGRCNKWEVCTQQQWDKRAL